MSGTARDLARARDVIGGVDFPRVGRLGLPVPRQLPGDARGFVGRERELEQLDRLLAGGGVQSNAVAITVISGTAGVGKTTLALHWAHRVRDRFPDGQLYVDLRGYAVGTPESAGVVLDRFLRALDVANVAVPTDIEEKAALFRSLLANRRVLIVLDNAASESQVRPLLPGTTSCLAVITSRNRLLGLVGRLGAAHVTLDVLCESEAVDLLRNKTIDFRDGDDGDELAELAATCARLPLALRIAAQRAASRPRVPLSEMIATLRDDSVLWNALSTKSGDGSEDGEAVHSVFAWSYRALPSKAARVFRMVGLHPGPDFSVGAAAALAELTGEQAQEAIDTLAEAHLVEFVAPGRFRLHDLLQAYALDCARNDESEADQKAALTRVLTWYLHAAHAAGKYMERYCFRPTPLDPASDLKAPIPAFTDHGQAARWYELEWNNLVAATRTAADLRLDRMTWQLAAEFRFFYLRGDQFDAGVAIEQIALEAARRLGDRYAEAEILDGLAILHHQAGSMNESATCHQAALGIRREIGDRLGEAITLANFALVLADRRRLSEAEAFSTQSLIIHHELGERRGAALVLGNLAELLYELGRLAEARDLVCQALALNREFDRTAGIADNLWNYSRILRALGQPETALGVIQQAVTAARRLDTRDKEAAIQAELAHVHQALGRYDSALIAYQHAVALYRRLGDRLGEAHAFSGVGTLHFDQGNLSAADAFHRHAIAILADLGDRWHRAVALSSLADLLDETVGDAQARTHRHEVLTLLAGFDDPAATALRDRTAALLETAAEVDVRAVATTHT
ncbi:MAG TPA: tetratricopeptide repeat protein [Actinocrinis sp.]|uniref:ATP-binding protein n=1 Tax=Actinocrinis sp. TaxID=1920516 RepID=UPI002DDD4963|nr:tetratricopeptide repeat protein [Actinocrinis sp.]HEV2347776.1 tetratricopeptide repeat protein [Actinocrinis sp.]